MLNRIIPLASNYLQPKRIEFHGTNYNSLIQAPHVVEGPVFQSDVLEKHKALQAEMNQIGATHLGLKSAKLLSPVESPKVIRKQYLNALNQLSPGDMSKYTQSKLLGLMEEMGDVAHATALKLASQTVLGTTDYKEFDAKAKPILSQLNGETLPKLWDLAREAVNNLPWNKSKGFVDFSKINGYQPGSTTSIPTDQLKTFLKLCFFDYAVRTHCQFPHSLENNISLKKNLMGEFDEFKVNAKKWAEQQSQPEKRKLVDQGLKKLEGNLQRFSQQANAENVKLIYGDLVSLGKTMFDLRDLSIGDLFDGAISKHMGRLAGQFLENANRYRGKTGYDSGKQLVKPIELVLEAASLKSLLSRNALNAAPSKASLLNLQA